MAWLVGDVGATKVHLAVYDWDNPTDKICLVEKIYQGANYKEFTELLDDFMSSLNVEIESACFGVAGPIIDNRCHGVYMPWIVDGTVIKNRLSCSTVHLINDLQAIAYGIVEAKDKLDCFVINEESLINDTYSIGIIAPGTGLGEAMIFVENQTTHVYPSEGGHTSFAPVSVEQRQLLNFLSNKYSHVSYDRVCSGSGIQNIYRYYIEQLNDPDFNSFPIPDVPTIVSQALSKSDMICQHTIALFLSILASEAGNLALRVLATGGIYITGGLVPRLISTIDKEGFMHYFCLKGRFSDYMRKVPIKIVLNKDIPVLGAASYLARHRT